MSFYLSNEVKEKISLGETIYVKAQEDVSSFFPSEKCSQLSTFSSASSSPSSFERLTPDDEEHVPSCFLLEIDIGGFVFIFSFLVMMAAVCGWLEKWLAQSREFAAARNQAPGAFDSLHAALEGETAPTESEQEDEAQDQDEEQWQAIQNEDEEDGGPTINNVQQLISEEVAAGGAVGGEIRSNKTAQSSKSTKEFVMPNSLGEAHSSLNERKLTDTF